MVLDPEKIYLRNEFYGIGGIGTVIEVYKCGQIETDKICKSEDEINAYLEYHQPHLSVGIPQSYVDFDDI